MSKKTKRKTKRNIFGTPMKKYPREVATRKYHKPMSDAEFVASLVCFSAEGAGQFFRDTMIEMLEDAPDGRLTIKQYKMLDAAMKKYCGVRIPLPVDKSVDLSEFPFLND